MLHVVEKEEEEGAKGSENENGDQVSEKKETTEGIVLTSIPVKNGLVTVHIIHSKCSTVNLLVKVKCLRPDDFTFQGESAGAQWVNRALAVVGKPFKKQLANCKYIQPYICSMLL